MSFDFIPLEYYTLIYYYIMFFVVFVTYINLQKSFSLNKKNLSLLVIIVLYMGLRPISGKYFFDMATYNLDFIYYQDGNGIVKNNDLFFQYFMKFCSGIMTANFFFLTCAFVYIYPLYLVSKKWFEHYWYYAFLLLLTSFSFWAYGTNGIRNGIAGSLFLLAISREKRVWQIALLFISINFHKTMLLPTLGFMIAQFYNKPKQMILFWIVCIPLSLAGGDFWESFFASLGFEDDRLSYLTEGNVNDDNFSSTGFRWDFLIYSGIAVYVGWYFIVKKKFEDKIYFSLFNIYLFANAFWILVIRANFSNRFAYLSWFIMALVIIYPFLKKEMIPQQNRVLAKVILVYFAFTFLMNVILAK